MSERKEGDLQPEKNDENSALVFLSATCYGHTRFTVGCGGSAKILKGVKIL